jgi:transposase-like protein
MTNFEKLRLLGESLHGVRWQNAVARDLGIHVRQVQRWVSGQYEPHEGHIADLIALARTRKSQIAEAIQCSITTTPQQ